MISVNSLTSENIGRRVRYNEPGRSPIYHGALKGWSRDREHIFIELESHGSPPPQARRLLRAKTRNCSWAGKAVRSHA